jgi:hypothetical protein
MVELEDFEKSCMVDFGTSEIVGYCKPWRSRDTAKTAASR